jgi:hypothetical protein
MSGGALRIDGHCKQVPSGNGSRRPPDWRPRPSFRGRVPFVLASVSQRVHKSPMSDPKTSVPPFPIEALPEPLRDLLNRFVQGVFAEGWEQGSNFTIARIFMAVSPDNSPTSPPSQPRGDGSFPWSPSKPSRMETRTLIDAVMKRVGPHGATPMEIFKSPFNEGKAVSRGAISKVLRRGSRPSGAYVNKGGGRYYFR